MTTAQPPTRAILVPSPFSSFLLPKNRPTPTPHPVENFFNPQISDNRFAINNLHFGNVNESVTVNPVFYPLFGPQSLWGDPLS
jgi:hypothetical protein